MLPQQDAQAACANWAFDGQLATPTTMEENMFIATLVGKPKWLGLSVTDFNVQLSDGTVAEYTDFGNNQPGMCVLQAKDSTWQSVPCNAKNLFVCERPVPGLFDAFRVLRFGLHQMRSLSSHTLVPIPTTRSFIAISC